MEANESDDILTVQAEIRTRWSEHFTDLLNINIEGNEVEENQLHVAVTENIIDEVTTLEVEAVIERSRNCKVMGSGALSVYQLRKE